MELIVKGALARVENPEPLTTGRVGLMLSIEFDSLWSGLQKAIIFKDESGHEKTIINLGTEVEVAPEVLTTAGDMVRVGVFGYDGDPANVIIPTVYAVLGIVRAGADPDVDPSTNPTLPVWGQIQNEIGDLNDLETTAKSNLVSAINEAAQSGGGGGGTSDHTRLTNRDAANQHPMSAITGLADALAGKQPSGDYATSADLDELANEVDTKQDAIEDLATIRSGAALGATALQSIQQATGSALGGVKGGAATTDDNATVHITTDGFMRVKALQEHQSLAAYRTASDQDDIDAQKQSKITANGLLKGDGSGGVTAAEADVDYQTPISTSTEISDESTDDEIPTAKAVYTATEGKLVEPSSGLAVGKYFRIASIDENGHAVLEAVDAPSVEMKIKRNGTALQTDSDGYVELPMANTEHSISATSNAGIIGISSILGFSKHSYGGLAVVSPKDSQISNRQMDWGFPRPLTTNCFDFVVKAAMTDGVGAAWTDTEKQNALARLGITVDENGFCKFGE